jgi:predicted enzyme related to lactoylglutathione lyase
MPGKVAHFEIYGDDPVKLGEFYKKLFGWKIDAVPGMEYWIIKTVNTDAKGAPTETGSINGGLMKRPMPDVRNWINYVSVESLDATVKHAEGMGAKVIRPKSPVPKMGWFSILIDPEQNVFAVWQDDSKAG